MKFLVGFSGYCETDDYQDYNKAPTPNDAPHIRYYPIDAILKGNQFDYSQSAVHGVQYCDQLTIPDKNTSSEILKNVNNFILRRGCRYSRLFGCGLTVQHPAKNT